MRKIAIVLFILTITFNLFAQPGDFIKDHNGFNIKANNIKTKTDSILYIDDYIDIDEYMPLSTAILAETPPIGGHKLSLGFFAEEYYKTKDIYQYKMFCIVYNEEVMILKVKKNRTHFGIKIGCLIFQEGIFEIDLEKMYQKYNDDSVYGIYVPQFPLEE